MRTLIKIIEEKEIKCNQLGKPAVRVINFKQLPNLNLTSHANITRMETCGASKIDHRISRIIDIGRFI